MLGSDYTAAQNELGVAVIRAGIEQLAEKLRTVLLLLDVQAYSYQEIAQIPGCTGGTVKSRLSGARTGMREWMAPYLY